MERTRGTLEQAELALLAVSAEYPPEESLALEEAWLADCRARKIPVIPVVTKADLAEPAPLLERLRLEWKAAPLAVSARTGQGIPALLEELVRVLSREVCFRTARRRSI